MKKSNEMSLKEVINELTKAYRIEDKLNEAQLINSWEDVAGRLIARHTTDLYIKKEVLFIHLDSAALRNELSYARESIKEKLNNTLGKVVIEEVVFR